MPDFGGQETHFYVLTLFVEKYRRRPPRLEQKKATTPFGRPPFPAAACKALVVQAVPHQLQLFHLASTHTDRPQMAPRHHVHTMDT